MEGSREAAGDNDLAVSGQSTQSTQENVVPSGRRRRRKPTLSCSGCVIRKIGCDRKRPRCTQCIRRESRCTYTNIANILESLEPQKAAQSGLPDASKDAWEQDASPIVPALQSNPLTQAAPFPASSLRPPALQRRDSRSMSKSDMLNADAEHPFHNYWTRLGGLSEIISIAPDKDQAYSLLGRYFESVDALYPIISKDELFSELEEFFSLSQEEMCKYDAAKLSLHFVLYAVGAQLAEDLDVEARSRLSDLYLSASHQSLCLHSYLNRFSFASVQSIVLVCYTLLNTSRLVEAWTFSGVLVRQAYGLRLNNCSDPDSINSNRSPANLRWKLWQAVVVQDTNLAFHLFMPPAATYHDIRRGPFETDSNEQSNCFDLLEEPMSHDENWEHDAAFLQSFWEYATFVQCNICLPRAQERPISSSATQKATLISQFRSMYSSWKAPFNSYDPKRFESTNPRLARQLIALSSHFFGVLTVLYLDEDRSAGFFSDIYEALNASHEALSSFFALVRLFPGELNAWGSYHTIAYSQATRIGEILTSVKEDSMYSRRDPRLMLAKSDFDRYLDILYTSTGSQRDLRVRQQRLNTLLELRNGIDIV